MNTSRRALKRPRSRMDALSETAPPRPAVCQLPNSCRSESLSCSDETLQQQIMMMRSVFKIFPVGPVSAVSGLVGWDFILNQHVGLSAHL